MYASKTPRDLNHDPYPRLDADGFTTVRPEFDHAQHNEPNQILVRLRDARLDPQGYVKSGDISKINIKIDDATPEEVDHARKVLTRLARMERAS